MVELAGVGLQSEELDFSQLIPEHQWSLYRPVLEAAQERGVRFAIGGGLAYSAYARRWRNTKDIDLFVLPAQRETLIDLMRRAGFEDYYGRLPYDQKWIFRGYRDGVIVDAIWQMANYRAQVDEVWVTQGREIDIHGMRLKLLPVEELVWSKLYVLQRDRCDWPDLLSILYVQGANLDWSHLLDRVGDDEPLIGALLNLLGWMCPARAMALPDWVWDHLGLPEPNPGPNCEEDRRRVRLLDSRNWFGPTAEGK